MYLNNNLFNEYDTECIVFVSNDEVPSNYEKFHRCKTIIDVDKVNALIRVSNGTPVEIDNCLVIAGGDVSLYQNIAVVYKRWLYVKSETDVMCAGRPINSPMILGEFKRTIPQNTLVVEYDKLSNNRNVGKTWITDDIGDTNLTNIYWDD